MQRNDELPGALPSSRDSSAPEQRSPDRTPPEAPAPATTENFDSVPEVPFYIPLTGPSARPRRTLKHNDTFAVFDSHGDMGASAGGPDGLFDHDTRFLSRLEFLINGLQPLLLGSNQRDDNEVLTVDLTNPDIYFEGHLVLPKDVLHIVRTIFVWRGTAYQRLAVHNHFDRPVSVQLSFAFGSDFADLFEVRGVRRPQRGIAANEVLGNGEVAFAYKGLDGVVRRTVVAFDPVPSHLGTSSASYRMRIEPHRTRSLFLSVSSGREESRTVVPFFRGMLAARRESKAAAQGSASIVTSNDIFNELLRRSVADLHMLTTATPQGPYPYAGIPWYSTTFGRDGLITAMQMLWLDPSLARGVLSRLAAFQAQTEDPLADAQPGKILHEMRGGEMAALREVPFGLYYGSVDSTPLFVLVAGLYGERTGHVDAMRELWPNIETALGWIDGPGDPDGDGFVEYHRATEEGLANQGWKDSYDAVFHADGRLARGPIALAEVQGYVYAAKRLAARWAARLGRPERARALTAEADRLAENFERQFWCPSIGLYALALDGDKKPCAVRSSNAGQVLFSGIASPERAAAVADALMQPRFFNGWGVRTIARDEARYNPMGYHNGTIWPHDNALIAQGMARYGLTRHVEKIFTGLFEAGMYMDLRRLPEVFCGFQRGRGRGPTNYPLACSPQAWAAGAPLQLLQSSLGLEFVPESNEIRLRNPRLPHFLDEVVLHDLCLGESTVDLKVRRSGEDVQLDVLRRQGDVKVSILLR